jgi:hypothetical protein
VAILSSQSWVAEPASSILDRIAAVLPSLSGEFEPFVLFLQGSALHGELCGLLAPTGRRIFLSDIDLGLLTRRRIPSDAREEISRRLEREATEAATEGPAARVGFYCEGDLGVQDPVPGLVETVRVGRVLWGDGGALRRFRVPGCASIPHWEARRLLSNRAIEWSGAAGDAPAYRVYAAAKLIADAAAVALLTRGAYRGGGYADRRRAADSLSDLPEDDRVRIGAWTDWRCAPRWESTPLGVDVEASARSPRLRDEVAAAVRGAMLYAGATDDPGAFLAGTPVRGRAWARAWKRWARVESGSLLRLGVATLTGSPRVLLWEAALSAVIGRGDRAERILRGLAGRTIRRAGEDRWDGERRDRRIGAISRTMDQMEID